jgi:N-acetylmuramic acid 6-phosphate etherase
MSAPAARTHFTPVERSSWTQLAWRESDSRRVLVPPSIRTDILSKNAEPMMPRILEILNLVPSPQSVDYVDDKKQFHLFSLLTEQRHTRTWNMSFTIQANMEAGLKMLLSVDDDVTRKIAGLARDPSALEQAAEAIAQAIRGGRKIYVYGCGATGRLAKQMESAFWRPFWRKVKHLACWEKLRRQLPPDIEEKLIGEMTGADRALVSSLEGFEDLQLIGKLQMQDRGVTRGDVVICVTEGGETSSVIGTILGALHQYGLSTAEIAPESRRNLYFIYNNPDEVLRPFDRSATVLNSPGITRINLATGPQAITGSTRLQATTSETFVVGLILEEAIARLLREHLSPEEQRELGFCPESDVAERLSAFEQVKASVDAAIPAFAGFSTLEADTYRRGRFATYFAKAALITVFIDNTERSPTFRLYPLDKVQDSERKCWVQVWTEASDLHQAWQAFLGRPFRGLDPAIYRMPFEQSVEDPYLRDAALRSLAGAGNDQEESYDFSFSHDNIRRRGPRMGDLGVMVLMDEEVLQLNSSRSSWRRFLDLFGEKGADRVVLIVARKALQEEVISFTGALPRGVLIVPVIIDAGPDPLGLRGQMALKMLLNAHSTGIMAALGRVIGNTMTNVSPSNLKLIGRATFLVMSHVNDTLRQPEWQQAHGPAEPLSFAETNAVLFDAMDCVRSREMGQTAEVALSVIRILEALRRNAPVSWDEARELLDTEGLVAYLARNNPALTRANAEAE